MVDIQNLGHKVQKIMRNKVMSLVYSSQMTTNSDTLVHKKCKWLAQDFYLRIFERRANTLPLCYPADLVISERNHGHGQFSS